MHFYQKYLKKSCLISREIKIFKISDFYLVLEAFQESQRVDRSTITQSDHTTIGDISLRSTPRSYIIVNRAKALDSDSDDREIDVGSGSARLAAVVFGSSKGSKHHQNLLATNLENLDLSHNLLLGFLLRRYPRSSR